jgi:hypothetical protein
VTSKVQRLPAGCPTAGLAFGAAYRAGFKCACGKELTIGITLEHDSILSPLGDVIAEIDAAIEEEKRAKVAGSRTVSFAERGLL